MDKRESSPNAPGCSITSALRRNAKAARHSPAAGKVAHRWAGGGRAARGRGRGLPEREDCGAECGQASLGAGGSAERTMRPASAARPSPAGSARERTAQRPTTHSVHPRGTVSWVEQRAAYTCGAGPQRAESGSPGGIVANEAGAPPRGSESNTMVPWHQPGCHNSPGGPIIQTAFRPRSGSRNPWRRQAERKAPSSGTGRRAPSKCQQGE